MENKNLKQCSHGYFSHNNCTDQDKNLTEYLFNLILNAEDGDYVVQAMILSAMKPQGW